MGKAKIDWPAIDRQIVEKTDVRAAYTVLGVTFNGAEPNADGWLACHALGREDRNASAAVNLKTGRYRDLGGEGASLNLWEAATRFGKHADWKAARKHFAELAGVQLPAGRPQAHPADDLVWQPWNPALIARWCLAKPGVTPEAVQTFGGRIGRYYDQYSVLGLPVFGPGGVDADPVGWVLMDLSGQPLPVYRRGEKGVARWVKCKATAGSDGGLVGLAGLRRLIEAKGAPPPDGVIWKLEGVSDALALQSIIAPDLRDRHVIVTNSGGAAERPMPWMATLFAGWQVVAIGDCDQPGQVGAQRWASFASGTAAEVRILKLPYPVTADHGRDLRDWIGEGHGFDELLALAEVAEPLATGPSRPTIVVDELEAIRVVDQAIAALADQPLFQRGGALVHPVKNADPPKGIQRPKGVRRISPLRQPRLKELLTQAAAWEKPAGGQMDLCAPPSWVANTIMARGQWDAIRPLESIIEWPVLRADGSILTAAGYDESTGLLLDPAGEVDPIPERPNKADVDRVLNNLLNLVCDFPFLQPAHRAAWLASLLSPLARFAFDGPVPLMLVDANKAGTGKGLLMAVTSMIITGRPMAITTLPEENDELRKRVLAIALAGDPIVLLDNITHAIGSAALDAMLTATSWSDRVLSASEWASAVPLYTVWYGTANNARTRADSIRRILHIRLETAEEHPELRPAESFQIPNLLSWARKHRPELLAAALTILRGYFVAGCPRMGLSTWGTFEAWSDIVRDCIVWAGLEDPGAVCEGFAEEADTEANAHARLLEGWELLDPDRAGLLAADVAQTLAFHAKHSLLPLPDGLQTVRDALEDLLPLKSRELPGGRAIGYVLRKFRRSVCAGRRFVRKSRSKNGDLWIVEHIAL